MSRPISNDNLLDTFPLLTSGVGSYVNTLLIKTLNGSLASPKNGFAPVSSSYAITPNEKKSDLKVMKRFSFLSCSGLA
jgi:hypothetical protein